MRQKTSDKIKELIGQVEQPTLILTQILDLLRLEDRADEMAQDVQELLFLANVTDSLVGMSPTHPIYKSVLRDVQSSLSKLKHIHNALPDDS
jgi:hypothetical protein